MGIVSNWLGGIVKRALTDESGGFFTEFGKSSSGVQTNKNNVVGISAVYAALNLLSSTIATLPYHLFRRKDNDGREIARDHSLYSILHDMPNKHMTSVVYRRLMMVNYYIGGAAHAIIKWSKKGEVQELIPVPFWRVTRLQSGDTIVYEITDAAGRTKRYNEYEIYRLENMGYSLGSPFKPIDIARDLFGLTIAAEQFGAKFFANGTNSDGILKHPQKLSDPAVNRLRKQLNERHQGVEKSHKTMILEEGLDFLKTTIAPNESQFIETRKFQVTEVARFFNVPPHLIMDLERSTYSNIEHQNINFVTYTLRNKLVEWEQEDKRSLMSPAERQIYYTEFSVDGLLRGDSKTRAEVFKIMRDCGVINADEWRSKENMNPLPDGLGQVYFMPLNMADVSKVASGEAQTEQERNLAALVALMTRNQQPSEKRKKEPEQRTEQARLSTAQIRSATKRHGIAKDYEPKIRDNTQKIVERETKDIRGIAKETLSDGNITAFLNAIETYYETAPEYIRKNVQTSFTALAKDIFAEAVREINFDGKWNDRTKSFVKQYLDAFAVRHINSSKGQLKSVASKAHDNGQTELEAVEERLSEWEEKRAKKTGLNESVRLAGAIAKTAYIIGGITRIMWVNMGSKSCPYCTEMDGKIVGVEQNFIYGGDDAKSDDGTMNVYQNTGHPPLHQGCVCTIVSA